MNAVRLGTVVAFDELSGLGEIEDVDGTSRWSFHCVEIADGTRTIEVGAAVSFSLLPKLGRYEAGGVMRR